VEEACRERVPVRLADYAFDAVCCSWQFVIGETLAMRYSDPAFMRFERVPALVFQNNRPFVVNFKRTSANVL
jgi:hypothetical protein